MLVDLPIEELERYRPSVEEPDDFEAFWSEQLDTARTVAGPPRFEPVETPLCHADVFDVTFTGHGGTDIKAWLLLPRDLAPERPLVVEFIGYGGGRGKPLEWLPWVSTGHPHFVMDTRGQGGGWRMADTPDPADSGGPATPGFLTRGIRDPREHYYTRLFVDAALAVDAARAHPRTGERPVVTTGASQGGGLSLAATHLNDAVAATLPDVPFLSDFRRAVRLTETLPYGELIQYCSVRPQETDTVFRTLSYIDVINHAKRIHVPALFSVGLIDDVTPASTVYAAFNHYSGEPKEIAVYPFNGHQGGGVTHFQRKLDFLATLELKA